MMQKPAPPWYEIENIDEIDSPALVVYPERVTANIRTARRMVPDASFLRPHVKTHKSADVCRLQISEGINKFKCATIAEAEMLALVGANDVLLAYQPVGPKVRRLRALVQRYPRTTFGCLVDDPTAAQQIAEVFASESEPLRVFLDLNVGMNRTGVAPGGPALELYRACSSMKGIRPVGLHAYDGHIHDKDPRVRSQMCDLAFASVSAMQEEVARSGAGVPVIVAGGSPTYPMHSRRSGVESSPGTFVYWDKSYLDGLPDQSFVPAALVIARVISRPSAQVLCLDLGHKSVAAENDIHHRVFFLNAPDAEVLSQSEEHLVLRMGDSRAHAVGEVFYGLPFHICPTCALYDRAATVLDRRAHGEWTMVARDRSINV
jgi:D-serine deaminase-like pyridoxal phosphate-dependent protein